MKNSCIAGRYIFKWLTQWKKATGTRVLGTGASYPASSQYFHLSIGFSLLLCVLAYSVCCRLASSFRREYGPAYTSSSFCWCCIFSMSLSSPWLYLAVFLLYINPRCQGYDWPGLRLRPVPRGARYYDWSDHWNCAE